MSLMGTVVGSCGVGSLLAGLRLYVGRDQGLLPLQDNIQAGEGMCSWGGGGSDGNRLSLQMGTRLEGCPVLYLPPYFLALPSVSGS